MERSISTVEKYDPLGASNNLTAWTLCHWSTKIDCDEIHHKRDAKLSARGVDWPAYVSGVSGVSGVSDVSDVSSSFFVHLLSLLGTTSATVP